MQCPKCLLDNPDTSTSCENCSASLTPPEQEVHTDSETLEQPVEVLSIGTIVAEKYRIEGKLGQGGMGVVYKAEDMKLRRSVALKFLPPHLRISAARRERFLAEARAAAALSHPNICVIHEVDEAGGRPYIAMEYLEGETLRGRIRRGGFDTEAIVDVAIQLAAGLAEAHRKGIIHRDIKSANIMITPEGQARIMDFGLAKVKTETLQTKSHAVVGTVPYMSPEQALGERVDHRTDIWSLGVVLYEMLSGQLPFTGDSSLSILHSIVHENPRPLPPLEPPVPDELRRVVARALKKKVEDRYDAAEEVLADLKEYRSTLTLEQAGSLSPRLLWRRIRRPRVALPALVVLLALIVGGVAYANHRERVRWARDVALPRIERIVSQNWREFDQAYALAEQAEKVIPHDPKLAELFDKCSFRINVKTDPPGASVYVKPYATPEAEWKYLGISPLERVRLPFGVFRWKLEKPGYETVFAAAMSCDLHAGSHVKFVGADLERVLDRKGSIPPGMVRVSGADTASGHLGDFFIDRYEVTNRQHKAFIDAGGYANRKYWTQKFLMDGKELSWEEALAKFVDRTGQPGPSTWEAGHYPEGEADFPVSGISWYEAAAYAEFAGKSLPTKDHWGLANGEGTTLIAFPQLGGNAIFEPFSNFFKAGGPVKVGSLPGVTSFGALDMGGNVREWCWNETPAGRLIRGGAWNDATYMFTMLSQAPAMDRSPRNGLRCALYPDRDKVPAAAYATVTFTSAPDFSHREPVSDAVFQIYKEQFAYDRTDLNARVEEVRRTPEWKQEKITFDAAYGGERVILWLFTPTNVPPPFQTVVYFPGDATAMSPSSEHIEEYFEFQGFLSYIVRSGRAAVFPVYKGTFERGNEDLYRVLEYDTQSHLFTDLLVQDVKDFRRCIDYLETRADIDATKIAYYGMSWGGGLGGIIPAVEERIRASVLVAGGFNWYSRAAADPLNYVTRVRIPTLMVNGKYDSLMIPETEQKPMFDLLGTPDKKWVLDETDHIPTTIVYMRETLAWLDRYLGPVRRTSRTAGPGGG